MCRLTLSGEPRLVFSILYESPTLLPPSGKPALEYAVSWIWITSQPRTAVKCKERERGPTNKWAPTPFTTSKQVLQCTHVRGYPCFPTDAVQQNAPPWQMIGRRVKRKKWKLTRVSLDEVMAMQGWQWIDTCQRYSEVFWGCRIEAERWRDEKERERAGARGPGTVMDHLHAAAALPHWTHPQNWWVPPLVSHSPSSSHIHYFSITFPYFPSSSLDFLSVSLCSFSHHFFHPLPLSHLILSHNFFLSSVLSLWLLTTPPTLCVNIKQESHGSAILIGLEGASLSQGDTFINDRSMKPCRCSITSAGACPWGP